MFSLPTRLWQVSAGKFFGRSSLSATTAIATTPTMPTAAASVACVGAYTLLMWMAYIGAECVSNGTVNYLWLDGLWKKMQYCDEEFMRVPSPKWALRAKEAHRNAVENLVVFAPLVILCGNAGIDVDTPASIYLYARLLHFPAQVIAFPVTRTAIWAVGWMASFYLAVLLLI